MFAVVTTDETSSADLFLFVGANGGWGVSHSLQLASTWEDRAGAEAAIDRHMGEWLSRWRVVRC